MPHSITHQRGCMPVSAHKPAAWWRTSIRHQKGCMPVSARKPVAQHFRCVTTPESAAAGSALRRGPSGPFCGGRRWGSRGWCRARPGAGCPGTAGTASTALQTAAPARSPSPATAGIFPPPAKSIEHPCKNMRIDPDSAWAAITPSPAFHIRHHEISIWERPITRELPGPMRMYQGNLAAHENSCT